MTYTLTKSMEFHLNKILTYLHGSTPSGERPALTGFIGSELEMSGILRIVAVVADHVGAANSLFRSLALGDFLLGGRLDLLALGDFLLGGRLDLLALRVLLLLDVAGLLDLALRILPSSCQRNVVVGRRTSLRR